MSPLHVHRHGPAGPAGVLAVHGLTGHGQRWRALAETHLPDVTLVAPDLLGHGRSPVAAPWTIDANVAALARVLDETAQGPVVVVGHSFGGAIALHLAATHPDRVKALVLLDPAVGLDGSWMHEIAESMFASPDYTDRAEARNEKSSGSWGDVDDAQLDAELDEHLVELPNGRVGWRICVPAMMAYWSELARDVVLAPKGIPTTLVRATRTSPPYVTADLIDGLETRLGAQFTLVDLECDHMVAQAKPAETARLIRAALES
ncbi:alpha/beta hydrolase [Mycobacterium sp. ACS4331]|uniref:alpha/beta fold hydrolase n=1 Tax=Mycobacterium sp. ACS4331 TaxID=1834121 RepID=UPI0007FFAB4B|nr:alpha/beta hydrolase [Mycobacterium sp. ACS4331]OBF28038.1 alpha/beta hydrolase [Mycobacterium sp. ACS4331]